MPRTLSERLGRGARPFRGLSNKARPDALTQGEFSDLLNVDFYDDAIQRRGGFRRKAGPLRNGSIRFDGRNDYVRITNRSAYQPTVTTADLYFGIGCVLRKLPAAAVTIVSQGFGAVGNLHFDFRYDPAAGTGALGAWVFRIRDATAGATRTYTIDDGDGAGRPVGLYRYFEWYPAGGATILTMWDATGVIATAVGAAITGYNWNAGQDIFVGVGTTALNTVGTDYADVTVCELRLALHGDYSAASNPIKATVTNFFYVRELTAAAKAACVGYWPMNDGDDKGIVRDAIASNHGIIPNQPPPWVRPADEPKILGQAAVEFKGGNQWLDVRDTTSGTTTIANVFTTGGAPGASWTVRVIYIPRLPPGATTVPNGTILWAGADPAIPAPISLRVVSDRFEAQYRDGAGTVVVTAVAPAPTVSSLAGKRVRLTIYRFGTAGNGSWAFAFVVDDGNPIVFGSNLFAYVNGCGALNPGVTSQDWALGNHVTNFAAARLGSTASFGASGALWGVIDDFQIIKTQPGTNTFVGIGISASVGLAYGPFAEVDDWNGAGAGGVHQMALYLRLNEGAGTGPLAAEGYQPVTNAGWSAYLRPQQDDGASWDIGLVDVQTPVRASRFKAYDRFANDRRTRRDALVASGTTLYAYDVQNAVLRVVGPLPAKADVWTAAQYGQRVMFAGAPGRRPIWTNGDGVYGLGIKPPEAQAVVTVYNGGAGAFLPGSYYLYVTFRNRTLGIESNPSPGTLVTFVAPDDAINSVDIPTSADPQVDQRRIWMTAIGGADGDVSYLVAEVNDNTTTSYTTDINAVSILAEAMTDYFGRAAAPEGTTIAQFKGYTLLGGSQDYPTRLYFSDPDVPDYWTTDDGAGGGNWEDLDLDSGRPITAIAPLLDSALVDFSDGRAVVTTTGDSDDPLSFQFSNRAAGAVGPLAIVTDGNQAYVINENGISVTTGYDDTSLSGPEERALNEPRFGRVAVTLQELERASIDRTMLKKIVGANRRRFFAALNRTKRQVIFGVSTTDDYSYDSETNGTTLSYDIERRIFTRWDLALDCCDQVDDSSGNSRLWGVSAGYIGEVDAVDQLVDGWDALIPNGIVSSVSGQTINVTGPSLGSAGVLRFLTCYVYKIASNSILRFRLRDNPSGTAMIAADGVDLSSLSTNDVFLVGGIPCWFELAARHGAALDKKRFRWLRLYGDNGTDPNYLRVAYKVDENRFDPSISTWTNEIRQWVAGIPDIQVNLGGVGGLVRIRVGEHPLATGTPADWMPAVVPLKISAVEVLAEEVDML